MVINLGAYSTEIIRAGIQAVPKGHLEAGESLAMSRLQVLRYVVLKQAFQKVYPALSSQIIIVMLGSAVVSQISAEDLTYAANYIQSRNFRAFEVYFVAALFYLAARDRDARHPARHRPCDLPEGMTRMSDFSFWVILSNLLLATRWTILLSLIAFVSGGLVGLALLVRAHLRDRLAGSADQGLHRILPGHAAPDAAVPVLLRRRAVRPRSRAPGSRPGSRSPSGPARSSPKSGAAASRRSRKANGRPATRSRSPISSRCAT